MGMNFVGSIPSDLHLAAYNGDVLARPPGSAHYVLFGSSSSHATFAGSCEDLQPIVHLVER